MNAESVSREVKLEMVSLSHIISMKDYIERALVSAYVSLLFTRGLITVVASGIDMFVKATVVSVFGFLAALFWLSTISTVRSIVTRTPPQKVEPLWPSNLKGAKKVAFLALLATSSVAATYIFALEIQRPGDLFEIILYAYTVLMMWTMFALESASTKIADRAR